jgi:hypothetical protein
MDAPPAPTKRRTTARRRRCRAYTRRNAHRIDSEMRDGGRPRCPDCGEALNPRAETRKEEEVVLDAVGFDLDCEDCRRFMCVIIHSSRSLRLLRMRRLVAAICGVGSGSRPRRQLSASF